MHASSAITSDINEIEFNVCAHRPPVLAFRAQIHANFCVDLFDKITNLNSGQSERNFTITINVRVHYTVNMLKFFRYY